MENNKQTAVEWLLEQIDDMYIHQVYDKQFQQAKEMEKQQIINSYRVGFISEDVKLADDYYNEEYGK